MGVTFSPDGETIATASADKTVRLWSIDGQQLEAFKDHTDWVRSVSFSPDGKTLASASQDGTVILWNLNLYDLMTRGCTWLHDYLTTNPTVSQRDQAGCP